MENLLTDRTFWKKFWESKTGLIFEIKRKYYFGDILSKLIRENSVKAAIELGGFPGYYATYLRKYEQIETTLLDYFIHEDITRQLLEANGLDAGCVEIIEADLFNYTSVNQYDMVLSFGLIEHFEDTRTIIETHLQFLKEEGVLFITLPNFRGLNGWVQKTFDPENYQKHNIKSMDPEMLAQCFRDFGLKNVSSCYYGKFSVWLENKSQKSFFAKALVKTIWIAGKLLTKIVPFESRIFSPYIIVQGLRVRA